MCAIGKEKNALMTPVKRVVVRTVRTYLQSLVALWPTFATGAFVLPPRDAGMALAIAAYTAIFPALLALIQNVVEELAKIEPGTTLRA